MQAGEGEDALAQLQLAMHLLDSSQPSFDLQRGIAAVEAASAAGVGAATEIIATFEAMGVARPQNWERALDSLQLAAEQGSVTARRAIMVLAEDSYEDDPGSRDWGELRGSVDISAKLAGPERRSLCDSPRIRAIEGFASAAECRWVIARARDRLAPAMIADGSGGSLRDPGRSNRSTEFLVPDMDVILEVLRARISAVTRLPLPVFETTQVLHYSVGQAFAPHFDYFDPANAQHAQRLQTHGQRIATFLIYLNEDFEGGETDFPNTAVRYRGRLGDAVFWANVDLQSQPDPRTLHAGLPPTQGEKWVLSQWIRDRAPAAV